MKIYRCRIKKVETEVHDQFIAAPSLAIALDKTWIENARQCSDEFWDNPIMEKRQIYIMQCRHVKSLKKIPSHWQESLPWFHPEHLPLDENAEMPKYFPKHDPIKAKRECIEYDIERMEHVIEEDKNLLAELKEKLKNLKSKSSLNSTISCKY